MEELRNCIYVVEIENINELEENNLDRKDKIWG